MDPNRLRLLLAVKADVFVSLLEIANQPSATDLLIPSALGGVLRCE